MIAEPMPSVAEAGGVTPPPSTPACAHPADELHLVRRSLASLAAREARLCQLLGETLAGAAEARGQGWRAEEVTRTQVVLDPTRLPLSVRADPRHYREETLTEVVLHPLAEGPEILTAPWSPLLTPGRESDDPAPAAPRRSAR